METSDKSELIKHLRSFKLDNRLQVYDQVLNNRTRYLTVVLENIDHSHNISAVFRTCECFGIQDVHVINDQAVFNLHKKVAMGSYKWLTLKKYTKPEQNNSIAAINLLKEKGYRIVATTPDQNAVALPDLNIHAGPFALFFGTELKGISETVKENADIFLTIPTVGFTQSLNISVSAAVILQNITGRLRNNNVNWELTENEKQDLMIEWLRKTIPKVELIEERFYKMREV